MILAKLTKMPNANIISGLKGTIDFYYWKGIPVARQWPRSPGKDRSQAVKAQWPAWGAASKLWVQLSKEYQLLHGAWCGHGRYNPRDLQIKSYLSNIYAPSDPAEVGHCQLLRYDWHDMGSYFLVRVWLDSSWLPVCVWSLDTPRLNMRAINDRGLLVRNKPVINFKSYGAKNPNYLSPSTFNSFSFSSWPVGQKRWLRFYFHDGYQNNRSTTIPIPVTR